MDEKLKKALEAPNAAVKILADFFEEIGVRSSVERTKYARIVLARMAQHDPPLLICTADEVKE